MIKATSVLRVSVALACCSIGTAWAAQERGDSKKSHDRDRAVRYERARDNDRDHDRDKNRDKDRDKDRDSYFERHGYTRLNIPKGHYPPPGECRICYPARPAGHQPPPMKCDRARSEVPPGAWVIRHPDDDPEHVHVAVYDERRPGSILVTGQFKI